jgi:phosphoglucosamine mutase
MEESGPTVDFINFSPDGLNINAQCGSTHPLCLAAEVVGGKYDAGFAYDGDGDRCIAVDEKGRVLSGDHIMAIMAPGYGKRLSPGQKYRCRNCYVKLRVGKMSSANGIKLLRTPVGDKFVLEEMDRGGYTLGGEQSGHIIFRDILQAGDGILTSLLLADVLARTGSSLSGLASVVEEIPQILVNVRVQVPRQVVKLPGVQEAVTKATQSMTGCGRVLVRPSGTEPVVRIMVESSDGALVEECIEYLKAVIMKESKKTSLIYLREWLILQKRRGRPAPSLDSAFLSCGYCLNPNRVCPEFC